MAEKSGMTEEMELLDDVEVLEDKVKDKKEEVEDIDETPSEEDDEEEKEKEVEYDDEEDDLDEDASNKPTFKDIKEKYPTLFKDFPDLKTAFFKANQYEQVFATVDDAKEAYNDNEAYINLRESVLSGNPELILNGIKETDKEAYTLFARKFIPTLWKNDKELYNDVATPIVEAILTHNFREGSKHGNEGLTEAVKVLTKTIFGLDDDEADKLLSGKSTFVKPINEPKSEEVTQRQKVAYDSVHSEVDETILKGLRSEIRRGLDPNNAMTPFLRKAIIEDTIKEINKQLSKDEKYQLTQSGRWQKSIRAGHTESSKRQLINAALSRAKVLVPEIRNKIRAAAFGETKKDADNKSKRIEELTPKRREANNGRAPSNAKGKLDINRIDMRKTSDLDLFSDNIRYKN